MAESSIFERIGGDQAVQAAVKLFYRRVLSDDRLAPFFDGIDIDVMHRKQAAFLHMAFGGPHQYTGRDLRVAHATAVARGLDDEHFDAVAGHLLATLQELSVPPALADEVMALVASTRADVLGR